MSILGVLNMRLFPVLLAAFSLVMAGSAAQARRTAIDRSDPNNPQTITLSGYCDFNGDDCELTYTLPYSVDFGGGLTDQMQIFGNGIFMFTGQKIFDENGDFRAYFPRAFVRPGLNFSTDIDLQGSGEEVYTQSGALELNGNQIIARWFTCYTPQNCNANEYSAIFTPQDGGFDVLINYGDLPRSIFETPSFDVGYQVYSPDFPGGQNINYTSLTSIPQSFRMFIPATFSGLDAAPGAVPEPQSWAMFIAGFMIVGAGMRQRKRGKLTAQTA